MNLADARRGGSSAHSRYFPFFVAALMLAAAVCGCRKSPESAPAPLSARAQGERVDISGHPELSKLKRDYARFMPFDEKRTINATADLKESYTSVLFPFPFAIVETRVKKGDTVRKGDPLFIVESAELEQAIERYQKTGDPGIAKSLRDIGLDPDSATADARLTITAPSAGTIAAVKGDAIPAQVLAVIQTKKTVTLQANASDIEIAENSRFFIRIKEADIEIKLVSRSGDKNQYLTLTFENTGPISTVETVPVQIVTSIEVFAMDRNAVVTRGDRTFCFVEVSDGILEKRDVSVIPAGTGMLVKGGLQRGETVINDNVGPIMVKFKI